MRISARSSGLASDTARFEKTRVSVVARPNPMALTTVPVTASSGHNPSSTTSPVFCRHRPSTKI